MLQAYVHEALLCCKHLFLQRLKKNFVLPNFGFNSEHSLELYHSRPREKIWTDLIGWIEGRTDGRMMANEQDPETHDPVRCVTFF